MIVDVGSVNVYLNDRDDRICSHILDGSGFEPESRRAWADAVQPGKVAIDIGAYTGLYAISAAKLGAQAIAMEPMPAQWARTRENIMANKVEVRLIAAAASDSMGGRIMFHNPRVRLTTGASFEKDKELHRQKLPVGCITVDSLALDQVAIIKLDVERHEPCALRGAANTIARNRPVLLVETLSDAARDTILAMLPDYEAKAVLDQRNTLFVPRESTSCRKDHSPEQPSSK